MQTGQWARHQHLEDEGMGGEGVSLPVSRVRRGLTDRRRGIIDPKGHFSGFNNTPAPVASVPYLLPGICHVVAFWGAYTPLKRLMGMATHMVFIQLRGSHHLVASRAMDMQCYLASTDGDSMEIPQALFTRASLAFEAGTRRSFAVLIFVLHPRSVGRAVRRLAPGTLPRRVLHSIHLIRLRDMNHTWNLDASLPSLRATPIDSSFVMKIFTLNVQHTVTSKLAPLRHFIEFHEFRELLCLQEIGTTSATFRFHPLYEPFFSVGVRKCPCVAILICRVAGFSYVKSEVRSNGCCVAVWLSMYDTSFLVIGLYLHASGQYEDYEPLLSWAQALVISSPGTWCVVLADLNRNPGWVTAFPWAPLDISDVIDQFVLDAQPYEVSNFPETPGDLNFPPFFHSGDRRLNFCKEKCRFSAIFPTIFPPFFSERPVFHPFFHPFFQPF